MRGMSRGLAIAALAAWTLAAPMGARTETPGCPRQGDVYVCQTEGFGTVFNQDVAQARDEALIDARRRALEQVAGVQVEAETVTRNQALFDQLIRTQTKGLVQADRILEEATTNDGRYRVRIEAWVKGGDVQERLESLVSETSIVVIVPEQNVGLPQAQPVIENEIVGKLVEAGYRVLDHTQVLRVAQRDQTAALLRGDKQTAQEIGLKFLSNLIVVGESSTRFSQNNQGVVSAYARITARAIESETGRVVANVLVDRVRGFGRDDVGAGEDALTRARKPAADQLLQALDGYFKRKERQLEIRIRKLPTLDEYRRAKALLEKQRWVSGVTEGPFSEDESVLMVTYPEKTLYLASRVGREPRYKVLEFDRSRILVEFRRQ
jgi:hypothetical protein